MSIELRQVSKRFGGVSAVEDVSLTVADGELVALLGPSGGGKTTVLRMIAGLEVPTSGDLLVRGERVNDVPVQKRNIGFVFQSYALFKTMSVFDNIAFGLKIRKTRRLKSRPAWTNCSSSSGSRVSDAVCRTNCPVASANGWPSPELSPHGLLCCCSTNPSEPWMPRSAKSCANGWCASTGSSTSPRSS
jgi:ABC-type sugar transport system ATPase subunit